MTKDRTPPNQELETAPDWGDEREMPTDPPAVVPAIGSEQTVVAAGMGLAGFAKQNPEGGLTGDPGPEEAWQREPDTSEGAFPAEDEDR